MSRGRRPILTDARKVCLNLDETTVARLHTYAKHTRTTMSGAVRDLVSAAYKLAGLEEGTGAHNPSREGSTPSPATTGGK